MHDLVVDMLTFRPSEMVGCKKGQDKRAAQCKFYFTSTPRSRLQYSESYPTRGMDALSLLWESLTSSLLDIVIEYLYMLVMDLVNAILGFG